MELESNIIIGNEYNIEKKAVFVNDTIVIDKFSFIPGIRYDYISTHGESPSPSLHLSNGKDICIDFYGGEPLLSFEQIKYISKKLKTSAKGKGGEILLWPSDQRHTINREKGSGTGLAWANRSLDAY